ncbi:MAG: 2,4-dihydroxyhept-2-ene-1,7-dioic acid aldolase [Hyphomicrobiaceae bacterium]|nr:2,4-dihydroxyhept-2-ene-1,7-dioic acid aldolase [Hyphomicrobiaceae bacterium]
MRPNSVKQTVEAGGRVVNAWCTIASSYVAEVVAAQGFDSVTIDLQHGAVDYADAFTMLQAISTTPAMPMVRVPWNDPALMMKLLDAGAYGVICPMINSADEARRFVAACRYPPMGYRSLGPNRAIQYAGADYASHANREVLLLAMVETVAGIANLDAILAVEGLDGVYVGPGDLSLAHGVAPSMQPTEPEVVAAIETVAGAARAAGRIAAIHTDGPDTANRRFEQGYSICTLQSDMRYIVNGARAALNRILK